MTDRPIIFSAPMVRALLAGRKTQTRRLATSPLRRVEVGDRLYVREAWSHTGDGVFEISQARMLGRGGVIYRADENPRHPHAKFWPSLHMPREFSRLTLIVEQVRIEHLQAISVEDALAEGIRAIPFDIGDGVIRSGFSHLDCDDLPCAFPTEAFENLWDSLHTAEGEHWTDNPDVVALTFRVVRGNIDRIEA